MFTLHPGLVRTPVPEAHAPTHTHQAHAVGWDGDFPTGPALASGIVPNRKPGAEVSFAEWQISSNPIPDAYEIVSERL